MNKGAVLPLRRAGESGHMSKLVNARGLCGGLAETTQVLDSHIAGMWAAPDQ